VVTWNQVRRSEPRALMRLLPSMVSLVVAAACVSSTAVPSAPFPETTPPEVALAPTPSPSGTSGSADGVDPAQGIWRFAGTLLLPTDANSYTNVLLDIEALKDGGWIAIQDRVARRRLPTGAFGGPFIPARGTVVRLDSSGTIVARQLDSESFTPTHLILFEASGVV